MSKFIRIPHDDGNVHDLVRKNSVKSVYFEAGLQEPKVMLYVKRSGLDVSVKFKTDEEALAFIEKYFPTK